MDALAVHQHLPLAIDQPPFAQSQSASQSARSSPDLYHHQLVYGYGRSTTSLQISTGPSAIHDHEPEEETAHPLRATNQPSLHHDHDHNDPQPPIDPSQRSIVDSISMGIGSEYGGISRPLTHHERELLNHLDRLKFFLATAPSRWSADSPPGVPSSSDPSLPVGHPNSAHPALNRFLLPNNEYVSCVLWSGLYHITGTDIVRALVFRFEAFGRPVRNMKKFEEGVFSDLRNLKPGVDACLEEPKSPFLDLLFKYQCIRTQKKQKVFYWFSVPHDRLFLDALERDLKREKMGLESTTVVTGEPALSFTYDPKRSLYEQFSKAQGGLDGEGELEAAVRRADEARAQSSDSDDGDASHRSQASDADVSSADERGDAPKKAAPKKLHGALHGHNSPFFSMFSLFEGSPTYKQRRKKVPKSTRKSPSAADGAGASGSADEFGGGGGVLRAPEPLMDRYGRDTTRLSAADMFLAQARGDFGAQSNPDLVASQKERQRRALEELAASAKPPFPHALTGPGVAGPGAQPVVASHYPPASSLHPSLVAAGSMGLGGAPTEQYTVQDRGRPAVEQRHTFPMLNYGAGPLRTNTQPYGGEALGLGGWQAAAGVGEDGLPLRTRAFVCPLFSCGRMFKRTEHLRRHLRTHTLERPYQCLHCRKRFSRSDNLVQHQRTHQRAGVFGPLDDESGDSEEVDELEGDDSSFDGSLEYIHAMGNMQNVSMCEVEVEGQVHDIQGDEEGLVMATGTVNAAIPLGAPMDSADEAYYSDNMAHMMRSSPEQSPFIAAAASPGAPWVTVRSQSGPAYSTPAGPSPHMRLAQPYGEYAPPMSAPSHKATFDHAGVYPPDLDVGGPGPIRRHRSATPSVARYGEAIRRPYSTAGSDHGGPAAGSRAYHPYVMPPQGQPPSAEASPLAYSAPLAFVPSQQHMRHAHAHAHSHSRSSSGSHLQDQMQQMLNIEQLDADALYAPDPQQQQQQQQQQQGGAAYADAYRTDSPMQYPAAGAAFELEAPHEADAQGTGGHGMYDLDMADAHVVQYGAHALGAGGFYNAAALAGGHPVSM